MGCDASSATPIVAGKVQRANPNINFEPIEVAGQDGLEVKGLFFGRKFNVVLDMQDFENEKVRGAGGGFAVASTQAVEELKNEMDDILRELDNPPKVINDVLDMRGKKLEVTFLRNGKTDKIYSVSGCFANLDKEID